MSKKLTEKQVGDLITKGKTGIIKGFITENEANPKEGKLVFDQEFKIILSAD